MTVGAQRTCTGKKKFDFVFLLISSQMNIIRCECCKDTQRLILDYKSSVINYTIELIHVPYCIRERDSNKRPNLSSHSIKYLELSEKKGTSSFEEEN